VTTYFAYGANMDPVHMADRCPGAQRLGLAELREHAFGIAAGGFGTVRPEEGGTVFGVLWNLGSADLAALDQFEGVADNFYQRRHAPVHPVDGRVLEAMIYCPTDDSPGTPAPGYLERIVEVAEMLSFPPRYVAALREFLPAPSRPTATS
jgi:gamma-glutamylcyclotransferase (GGCT)/AIG2-like uncharacterized protein YtfP